MLKNLLLPLVFLLALAPGSDGSIHGSATPGTSSSAIVPGSGWSGATAQPSPLSTSGLNGTANVIARWDIAGAPRQVLTAVTNICVIAEHPQGISYVQIGADGGSWVNAVNVDDGIR